MSDRREDVFSSHWGVVHVQEGLNSWYEVRDTDPLSALVISYTYGGAQRFKSLKRARRVAERMNEEQRVADSRKEEWVV